jgi:hypothetical protein
MVGPLRMEARAAIRPQRTSQAKVADEFVR